MFLRQDRTKLALIGVNMTSTLNRSKKNSHNASVGDWQQHFEDKNLTNKQKY